MKVLVVALLALLLSVQTASAQQQPIWPEEITLDGIKFRQSDLNGAFAEAVFTKDMMNDRKGRPNLSITKRYGGLTGPEEKRYSSLTDPESIKREYPWLYPHMYPSNGLPRLLSVNKWNKPIRITFGMPNDIKPYVQPEFYRNEEFTMSGNNEQFGDVYRALVPDIKKFSAQLSQLTGLNISYLAHELEIKDDLAEIRINIQTLTWADPEHHYKMKGGHGYGLASYGPNSIPFHGGSAENVIKTGFVFTAASTKQVDGYILTNAQNEIDMAVCYIWSGHEPDMIKKLVHECIIRSLGMPGAMKSIGYHNEGKTNSYMTLWNDPAEWPEKYRKNIKAPTELSEFDQFMIKTLYNPALKPGMDYVQAQKILLGLE